MVTLHYVYISCSYVQFYLFLYPQCTLNTTMLIRKFLSPIFCSSLSKAKNLSSITGKRKHQLGSTLCNQLHHKSNNVVKMLLRKKFDITELSSILWKKKNEHLIQLIPSEPTIDRIRDHWISSWNKILLHKQINSVSPYQFTSMFNQQTQHERRD